MTLSKQEKEKAMEETKRHESDTGSPEVQISLLSQKIDKLSRHLKKNRKDKHSRRGLLGMVSDRRGHLSYLKKKDAQLHDEMLRQIKE